MDTLSVWAAPTPSMRNDVPVCTAMSVLKIHYLCDCTTDSNIQMHTSHKTMVSTNHKKTNRLKKIVRPWQRPWKVSNSTTNFASLTSSWGANCSLLVHVCPFPANPGKHWQSCDPGKLTHIALLWQRWAPLEHSLMSVRDGKSKVRLGSKYVNFFQGSWSCHIWNEKGWPGYDIVVHEKSRQI